MSFVTTTAGAPVAEARKLRRDVGMVGLLFASVGSIIGSGWLFGALNASLVAGPASLISWVLGGAAVILLALIHAELGGMYPVAGGSARFPHYAFGSLIGFASGWFAFLGAVTTAPIEVEAALQYAHKILPNLTQSVNGQIIVTPAGYVVAALLMPLVLVHQCHGRQVALRDEQGCRLVEDHHPGSHGGGATDRVVPPEQLHRRGRLHPVRVERDFQRHTSGRGHLRLPRLRASHAAGSRDA